MRKRKSETENSNKYVGRCCLCCWKCMKKYCRIPKNYQCQDRARLKEAFRQQKKNVGSVSLSISSWYALYKFNIRSITASPATQNNNKASHRRNRFQGGYCSLVRSFIPFALSHTLTLLLKLQSFENQCCTLSRLLDAVVKQIDWVRVWLLCW